VTILPLSGRVAIVTGAGRGYGAVLARDLAFAGASVCAADLNPDRAELIASEIADAGGTSFGWQVDVSNKFQAAAMIETTRDRFGHLDVLVHCAHVSPSGSLLPMDEWNWRRTVEVNLSGAFIVAQLCGRVMADERGGVIALFADQTPAGGSQPAYALTQAAVAALSKELAAELTPQRVKVFAFSPDAVPDVTGQLIARFS
jgi:NAD(P)-dependent dehydrogenase (short-subunit alcohol dehydrogenase family)